MDKEGVTQINCMRVECDPFHEEGANEIDSKRRVLTRLDALLLQVQILRDVDKYQHAHGDRTDELEGDASKHLRGGTGG